MGNLHVSINQQYRNSICKSQENNHLSCLGSLYHYIMEIKTWVLTARKHAELTQEQLGERMGVTKGNVSAWENARHEPSWSQILKINEISGYPLPLNPSQYNAGEAQELRQGRYVAIVGIGQGGPDGHLNIEDYAPGEGEGLIYTYSPDAQAYGIRVRGDSMRPRIKSGEFIVAEPNVEAQPGDDVVVMRKDGRAFVKEFLWMRDDEVSLGSINASVPPITMALSEIESIHRVAAIVPRGSALLKSRM